MYEHEGAVSKIVVVGDIHGDLSKAKQCCVIAGLCDPAGDWRSDVPRNTVVVQIGDQIDGAPRLPSSRRPSGTPAKGGRPSRHDCREAVLGDIRVMAFFDRLDRQATAAGKGCRVYSLIGNHEMNNVDGNTAYADVCEKCRDTRVEYFRRGGAFAEHLSATRRVCIKVGGVLFCHAGVCPRHLAFLDSADEVLSGYLLGRATAAQSRAVFAHLTGPEGMLCHRSFSPDESRRGSAESADAVRRVLLATGCNAMVLGHNAHEENGGITASHDGRVWVVDPGMSSSIFGAPAAVLEMSVEPSGQLTVRTLRARAK
jgi:hypothetical protein